MFTYLLFKFNFLARFDKTGCETSATVFFCKLVVTNVYLLAKRNISASYII